jgi:hypothetical protein
MDPYHIGMAKASSELIEKMVAEYLVEYKFKDWLTHEDRTTQVTDDDKQKKAREIAHLFCSHSTWKAHDKGISREVAWTLCKLKISAVENEPGLAKALRRFWALLYFTFENTSVRKIYSSDNYFVAKSGTT